MILINSASKNTLRMFQPFLPIFVPVGIGCLLAACEKQGVRAYFIDEQVDGDALGVLGWYMRKIGKPYIFGFSVLTAEFKNAIFVSSELKKLYPDSIILFGGIHPTAMPDEVMGYDHVDFVIRGEGEKALVELYKCIKAGKDFTHLDNISYRKNDRVIHNKVSALAESLDSFPPFPYHLFNNDRYDLGFILSSRGCPYECIFCSNRVTTGRRYRFKSPQSIIAELKVLHYEYGRKYIQFVDDNLLVSKERIYEIMDNIKKIGLDKRMTFNFQARGDNVNYRLLQDLYNSGFRSIFLGIETSSDEIMKTIKKNETVKECVDAVRMAKEIGFHVSATFIYGLPGETHKDRMACMKMSSDLKLDMVRYNNATPYPGTELYEIAKKENRLMIQGLYENFNSVSTFVENPLRKIPFSYVPVNNTEEEIRMDVLYSYLIFYLNLGRLGQIFKRPDLGAGWFNAGERVTDLLKKIPALIVLFIMLVIKFTELFYYSLFNKISRGYEK